MRHVLSTTRKPGSDSRLCKKKASLRLRRLDNDQQLRDAQPKFTSFRFSRPSEGPPHPPDGPASMKPWRRLYFLSEIDGGAWYINSGLKSRKAVAVP